MTSASPILEAPTGLAKDEETHDGQLDLRFDRGVRRGTPPEGPGAIPAVQGPGARFGVNVAIFGASGRTGRHLVRQALDHGHHVRAFARTPARIDVEHPRLEIVQGDVQDAAAVERGVAGVDAVISALGPTANRPDPQVTRGTRHILEAMHRHGVRRIVVTGGAGVGDPHDRPTLLNRLVTVVLKAVARQVYEDMRGATELVRSSDLDWTVVRLPRLTDDPATGTVRSGYLGGDVGLRIGRADAASFVLDQLDTQRYLRAAPVISA